jgi:hypothetical protein
MTLTNEQIERLRLAAAYAIAGTDDGEDLHDSAESALAATEELLDLRSDLLALRAEVERLKSPEVVLAEAERLLRKAEVEEVEFYPNGKIEIQANEEDDDGVRPFAIASTLPEAFAKLREVRCGK